MARLWSGDLAVTNPLNKFVTKQQVLGMVDSGFLIIASYDRQIEYIRVYGDVVIVAGRETVVWSGKMPNAGKPNFFVSRSVDETSWTLAGDRASRERYSHVGVRRLKPNPPTP